MAYTIDQSTMTTFLALPIPIRRFVDDDQWEAEDLAGRLGIVAHAAFLRAGFVPYSAEPKSGHLLRQVDDLGPSSPSLSRRYTAPQLLARHGDGSPTESVVQELRAVGAHGGGVAFQAYLATGDGDRRCLCRALLDEDTLAPILSGGVEDTARALGTEASGAWLWRSLTDWVCRVLLLELARRNGLPVTSFSSLPDDVRAEILKRLTDGDDLARVECTSRQLRRLAAELDVELWKPLYEELQARQSRRWWWPPVLPNDGESSGERVVSWKERSYCGFEAFKTLAKNYLNIVEHELFGSVEKILGEVNLTPADVAECLVTAERAGSGEVSCLEILIDGLKKRAEEKAKAEEEAKAKAEAEAKAMEEEKAAKMERDDIREEGNGGCKCGQNGP
ncbi:hypothetical protein ACP70R_017265 [Stipagrostis hirtigluma subsp. patula]